MRRTREKTREIKNNTTTATAEKGFREQKNLMEARRERCNVDKNFSPQVLSLARPTLSKKYHDFCRPKAFSKRKI